MANPNPKSKKGKKKVYPREQLDAFLAEYQIDFDYERCAKLTGLPINIRSRKKILELDYVKESLNEIIEQRRKESKLSADMIVKELCVIYSRTKDMNKFQQALKALELLGKYYGLFTEKVQLSGPNNGPIEFKNVEDMTDDELMKFAFDDDTNGNITG